MTCRELLQQVRALVLSFDEPHFILLAERELLILQGLEDLGIYEDQNAVFVCDISVEDVAGEWYKNGDRIQPSSTIKIRQEGSNPTDERP